MSDFLSGAFPWVAFGLAIAVVITYLNSKNVIYKENRIHEGRNRNGGKSQNEIY